jgi:thiamine pyrophosphokinase
MPAEESQPELSASLPGKRGGSFLSIQPRAIIFANGKLSNPTAVPKRILPGDMIVAADGGAGHCLKLNMNPDILIGDFDSIDPAQLQRLQQSGTQIIRHPARKDYTDLELALQHVQSLGVTHCLVFAGLGARWDQTLANLLLPATVELSQMRIDFIDGNQELTVLHSGDRHEILGRSGDTVSLIPLNADVHGVSTEGLEYPLADDRLVFGATRGVSNVLVGEHALVSIREGLLLCAILHHESYSGASGFDE